MLINLNKGHYDWTKEDIVLVTPSQKKHHYPKELSSKYIQVEQNWNVRGFDIVDNKDYLSIKIYYVPSIYTHKVKGMKGATTPPHFIPYCLIRDLNNDPEFTKEHHINSELRIYPDKQYVFLQQITFGDQTLTYVVKKEYQESYRYRIFWGSDLDDAYSQKTLQWIHIIKDEKDILNYKSSIEDHSSMVINYLYSGCTDITYRYIPCHSYTLDGNFGEETKTIVNNFFRPTKHKVALNRYRESFSSDSLNNFYNMVFWLKCPEKLTKRQQSQEEMLVDITKDITEWQHPEKHINENIWMRKGDNVILMRPRIIKDISQLATQNKINKQILIYNTKNKKRYCATEDFNHVWSVSNNQIPNLLAKCDYIRQYDYYNTCPMKTIIKDNLSFSELFKDTNVGWLIDNLPEQNIEMININQRYGEDRSLKISLSNLIKNNVIDYNILAILLTSNDKLLELLLKSKLFNLYLHQLVLMVLGEPLIFLSTSKINNSQQPIGECLLSYKTSGKNLKQMFGVNIDLLRQLNDIHVLVGEYVSYTSSREHLIYTYPHGGLLDFDKCLNVKLNSISFENLFKAIVFAGKFAGKQNSSYTNIWTEIGDIVNLTFPNAKPKEKWNFIIKYFSLPINFEGHYRPEFLQDYLKMRLQLQNLAKTAPEKCHFNGQLFPAKVKGGKVFIQADNENERYKHYETYFDENGRYFRANNDFATDIKRYFRVAENRHDIEWVYDDHNQIIGASINMTIPEKISYLHDVISDTLKNFTDETKQIEFQKAVDRIKPLEWKDDKMGLEIIAPKTVKEISQEGTILCHCVESYISSIIKGTENILFLRRTDMKDSPYYTVEVLKNRQIRQVHCYRNGDPTKEGQEIAYLESCLPVYNKTFDIQTFLQKWAKAKKLTNVKSSYGALCAIR